MGIFGQDRISCIHLTTCTVCSLDDLLDPTQRYSSSLAENHYDHQESKERVSIVIDYYWLKCYTITVNNQKSQVIFNFDPSPV